MISREQLECYARFGGDVDGLQRAGSLAERALMADGTWAEINALRDGLARVGRGLAAPEYAAWVEREAARLVADPAARAILDRIVADDITVRPPAA